MNVGDKFFRHLVDTFVEQNIVKEEQKEWYIFGMKQGAVMLFNLCTAICIGLYFHMVWQTLLFLFCYIPLRTFAGGYHARTQFRCYVLSVGMILLALVCIREIPWSHLLSVGITVCSCMIIFCLVPIEDPNKPLDSLEVQVYGQKAKVILAMIVSVISLGIIRDWNMLIHSACIALGMLAVMLILGKMNLKRLTPHANAKQTTET